MRIPNIFERKEILPYLEARGLVKQYKKAKSYVLAGNIMQTKLKERQPKGSGIWSFRINKQFRALAYFSKEGDLIVAKIDNHQQ